MAIQPIDLSVMYSQMDKVAKYNASSSQGAELANSVNRNKKIQEENEQKQQVKKAANEEVSSSKINADGKNNNQEEQKEKEKNKEKVQTEEQEKIINEIKDPLLGQHIDITR